MKRLLTALTILATATIFSPASAQAVVPTTNFHFEPSAVHAFDSLSTPMTSGVPVAVPTTNRAGATRYVVNAELSGAMMPTWLYFHECGQLVDRTKPAANYAEPGFDQINLAPLPGNLPCMTMYGNAVVQISIVGYQDSTAGLDYVAHDTPTRFDVTPTGVITTINVTDASVPANATAVALWVSIEAPDDSRATWLLLDCETQEALGQNVTINAGGFGDNLVIAPIDANGNACFTPNGITNPVSARVSRYGYLAPGATATAEGLPYGGFVEQTMPGFVAQTPSRLFDTRENGGAPIAAGETVRFQMTGLPEDATAVALNVTATQTSAPGYVSVYPCDAGSLPDVSNVNFTGADQTVPNFALVSLGFDKELCFYALQSTHLVVDISGYYLFGGGDGYVPVSPYRLFDTRNTGRRLAAGTVYQYNFSGAVSTSSTAVVMNVTVTGTGGPGFVTVFPCGTEPPEASNLNYTGANQTRPNLVTVKLPADKRVCFYTLADTHLLADFAGYYSLLSNVGLLDYDPFRVFDTREPAGSDPLPRNTISTWTLRSDVVKALAWNLTATQTTAPGYVSGFPCGVPEFPTVSNVNFTGAGQTVANFSILTPDAERRLCFYTSAATHLIADEFGVFTTPLPWEVYYDGEPPP